jgi:gamma-glutamyltranspeptidase/glutathione hydrolase
MLNPGLTTEQVMTRELRAGAAADRLAPPREPAMGYRGMAATAHPFASQAALEVLRHGGNAVDAAIAAAAVLMTVEPRNGHLGGDPFLQIGFPSSRANPLTQDPPAP